MWRVAAVTGAALMASMLAGCGGDLSLVGKETEDTKRFAWKGDTLRIESEYGDVDVVPGAGSGLRVDRLLRGEATKEGNASWALDGDTLRLTVKCEGVSFVCGGYIVRVPRGTAVEVATKAADVRIDGITRSSVETDHGDITVDGATDRLSLKSVHGDITAGDITAKGASTRVTMTSTHGDLRLTLTEAPEKVVAKTTHGDVVIGVPARPRRYRLDVQSKLGEVTSALREDPDSPRSITAESTHGDIRLKRRSG